MMRLPEWRARHQAPALQQARDGMHQAHFQSLGWRKIWQQRRQSCRQHGFAATGRANHQQVVPARRGNFQSALRGFLPLHIGKAGACRWRGIQLWRLRRAQYLYTLEVIEQRWKIRRGEHFNLPGPGRFTALRCRADQPQFAC